MQTTFGTDPEFVVYDKSGSPISAIQVLPNHGKNNRKDIGNGMSIFYDNVQLELNLPPAKNSESLVEILSSAFSRVSSIIKPYHFLPIASVTFPEKQIQHPDSKLFGCDPELCCYELAPIEAPDPLKIGGFRSAGGHIHLGGQVGHNPLNIAVKNEDTFARDWGRIWTIRMMDLFVGLTGVVLDNDPSSANRRKLYGKAGSHRVKDYGVEYRSVGNFWLACPEYVRMIYDLSMAAVECVRKGTHLSMWKNETEANYPVDNVRKAINETDKKLAKKLIDKHLKPIMDKELFLRFFAMSEKTKTPHFHDSWGI